MKKRTFVVIFILLSFLGHAQTDRVFSNPIIPGFHPDPSICRVGDDYYLINSSFEWFPGIPIFHSKDLVNWEQIGHVLDRPSQLNLPDGMAHSNGIWAPTIRYHEGLFYVIVTCQECGGNFYVTALNPEGPWSEPVFIADAPGIDPEIFFDDDGKTYYVGCAQGKWGEPRRWQWEDRIYIQDIDLKTGKLKGEKTLLTTGHATNAKWCEGPHIVKRNGKYFLFTAEGGTWNNHAVTCHISDSVKGPYLPIDANPVLTHRYLGQDADITSIGHADLVETQFGDWYAVALGVRPIDGFRNLGRETFLVPLRWEGDQPVFNPGIGRILAVDKRPNLPWHPFSSTDEKDEFTSDKLGFQYNFLRTPERVWYTLKEKAGWLGIELRPQQISGMGNPSLIARRQAHHNFEACTKMNFVPGNEHECAGLVILQNNRFNYRLLLIKEGRKNYITLIKAGKPGKEFRNELVEEEMARVEYDGDEVVFSVEAVGLDYQFYFGKDSENMIPIGGVQDGRILSSNWAGGFIGAYVGMYVSSNGEPSDNQAWFDYFEYQGKD